MKCIAGQCCCLLSKSTTVIFDPLCVCLSAGRAPNGDDPVSIGVIISVACKFASKVCDTGDHKSC